MLDGEIQAKIHRFKYEGKTAWAPIFGRLVVGWLDRWAQDRQFDLITPIPTYLAPGSNTQMGHTERIIRAAAAEDQREVWPFDITPPTTLLRTAATAKSANKSYAAKAAAGQALFDVLRHTSEVTDATILLFDDVCTTGHQLDAAARYLLSLGAYRVEGLVLARAPWT